MVRFHAPEPILGSGDVSAWLTFWPTSWPTWGSASGDPWCSGGAEGPDGLDNGKGLRRPDLVLTAIRPATMPGKGFSSGIAQSSGVSSPRSRSRHSKPRPS
ncbi:MAG TPA: hypothetical protein VF395_04010, partial [Polyangiaceae bacterium]